MSSLTDKTRIVSGDCILLPKHIWVKADDVTVQPSLDDVGGISGFYRPPLAGPGFRVSMFVDEEILGVDSYAWQVDVFERKAKRALFEVDSFLVPANAYGLVQKVSFRNASEQELTIDVCFCVSGGFGNLASEKWGWVPPREDKKPTYCYKENALSIHCGEAVATLSIDRPASVTDSKLSTSILLPPKGCATLHVSLSFAADQEADSLAHLFDSAKRHNQESYSETIAPFPTLTSSNKELESFYNRSLTSFHSCIWKSPSFVYSPFMSESGIDGGAVCNYPWGIAYICKILALSHPALLKKHLIQAFKTDLLHHYAYTPLDGKPVGPWYAYNQYSLIACAYYYVTLTGDIDFLYEIIDGKSVFDHLLDNACHGDDFSQPAKLIDYGTNENLLELKLTHNYEHYVPSPNAERCWNYRAVARLGQLIEAPAESLLHRANELQSHLVRSLWNEDLGWLSCLDQGGNRNTSWSIQVFDVLRTGILEDHQISRLISHLNDKEFLSKFGVHSLSKLDPGYDVSDVDWGGPGVYAGDGPELVEDLYLSGCYAQADTLLGRLLWWGDRFPYYPQAILASEIGYRHDGRANVIAGLKAAECCLFGLLGLRVDIDGTISVKPHLPAYVDGYSIEGIKLHNGTLGVHVSSIGFKLVKNGIPEDATFPLDQVTNILL